MLTFCRHSNLSSGSARPAAPGPAEVVVKLLRMLPPLQPLPGRLEHSASDRRPGGGGQTPTPYSCLTSSMTNVLSIELMFSCLPSTFSRSCW